VSAAGAEALEDLEVGASLASGASLRSAANQEAQSSATFDDEVSWPSDSGAAVTGLPLGLPAVRRGGREGARAG
jgi:hypothetical protein